MNKIHKMTSSKAHCKISGINKKALLKSSIDEITESKLMCESKFLQWWLGHFILIRQWVLLYIKIVSFKSVPAVKNWLV